MSINPKKLPKTFAILPKWRNFAKFGHTSFESFITKMLSPRFPYIFALRRTIHEEINSDFATQERIRPKYL